MTWTADDIPDLSGRRFVVTGANGDIGAEVTRALAARGAHVVMACRNVETAERIAAGIDGAVEVAELDLGDLRSVRSFASRTDEVDVLVNNAGLLAVPEGRTADGFESHLGVNHLGHFALTGLLLDRLTDRVVTVSSVAHRQVSDLPLDERALEAGDYDKMQAYARSKLANLVFARELQRRLVAAGAPQRSYAAHPGVTKNAVQSADSWQERLSRTLVRVTGQTPEAAARSLLYAATVPDADPATYWGPTGAMGIRGAVGAASASELASDAGLGARLWERSEELTGVTYPV